LGESLRFKRVAFDPIFCPALAFHDLRLVHAPRNAPDFLIGWLPSPSLVFGEYSMRGYVSENKKDNWAWRFSLELCSDCE
jgi:hypothetical protein